MGDLDRILTGSSMDSINVGTSGSFSVVLGGVLFSASLGSTS
jgi:hypothetical protein